MIQVAATNKPSGLHHVTAAYFDGRTCASAICGNMWKFVSKLNSRSNQSQGQFAKAPSPWLPTPCFRLALAVPSVSEPKNDSGTEDSGTDTSPWRWPDSHGGPYEIWVVNTQETEIHGNTIFENMNIHKNMYLPAIQLFWCM